MNRKMLACAMALLMISTVVADAPEKKKKGKKRGGNPAMQVIKQLEKASVTLTDEQKETIRAKGTELKAKMGEIQSAHELTPKLVASVNAARKAAREAGKKGKEIDAAAFAEAGLNDSQSEGFTEITAARTAMVKEVIGMLTDEQKESLPKGMQRLVSGGKKGKKAKQQ